MTTKKGLLYFSCALLALAMPTLLLLQIVSNKNTQDIDTLKFSNTQTWDVTPYASTQEINPDLLLQFNLDPPAKNSSTSTSIELKILHEYAKLRTNEKLNEITNELEFETTQFGKTTLGKLFARKPLTESVFRYALEATDPITMEAKKKYDRVRPSYLDNTLTTAIPVPTHPAYPSAHATNAHLTKHILEELDPEAASDYKEVAERISINREIAGVHYPSDSRAGENLAKQFYSQLLSDPYFVELLEAARAEW